MPRIPFPPSIVESEDPVVTLNPDRFVFNARFARLADLQEMKRVLYSTDDEARQIAFKFSADPSEPDSFALQNTKGGALGSFRCASTDLISKKPWLKAIALQADLTLRKFKAIREGKEWVINLIAAFENRVSRSEVSKIPADLKGIYRYVNSTGEVVYVGKGGVRSRAAELQRKGWIFETIEYAEIVSEKKQFEAESFWIQRFTEQHKRLPYYNRQAGNAADEANV